MALVIDAKNDRAARWYERYGAIAFEDNPLTLVLPLETIRRTLVAAGKLQAPA